MLILERLMSIRRPTKNNIIGPLKHFDTNFCVLDKIGTGGSIFFTDDPSTRVEIAPKELPPSSPKTPFEPDGDPVADYQINRHRHY